MKSDTKFFYYRNSNPYTCYFDFSGCFGKENSIKAYEFYTTLEIVK